MNIAIIKLFIFVFTLTSTTGAFAQTVTVEEPDAIILYRYVAGPFDGRLPSDTENEILHSELMMCSILFNMGNKIMARCLLPTEQIKIEHENAVEVTKIMKKYGMPSNFKLGYETVEAGLDCTKALSGKEYPKCFLTPKSRD